MKEKQIYFQSSLPRSGSTLLQNILGQNPDFYVTPTSGVLELLFSARQSYSTVIEFKAQDKDLMRTGFLGFCKNGLQGFYQDITDKPIVVDKCRGWGIHYNFLNTFIDNPKIICMVRDLRGVYASMEKNFRKNPEKSKGTENWSTGEGTTIQSRVDVWSRTMPVGMSINRLKEVIDTGVSDNILFIKYEELVSEPKNIMKIIYTYLEQPYYVHDFDNINQITKEDDVIYGHYGDHIIKNKLENISPNYEKILGKEVCDNIFNSYPWFYKLFQYE